MLTHPTDLDRMFHFIMKWLVKSGQTPHDTEISSGLGISVEEGRKALHDLMATPGIHGILSLPDLVKLFSGSYFRRRLDPDWVSHRREYVQEMVTTLAELGKSGPFWKRPKP